MEIFYHEGSQRHTKGVFGFYLLRAPLSPLWLITGFPLKTVIIFFITKQQGDDDDGGDDNAHQHDAVC